MYKLYNGKSCSLAQLLARPEISYADIASLFPEDVLRCDDEVSSQIEIAITYEGYISRQALEVTRLASIEEIRLPEGFEYHSVTGLRTEARIRLSKVRPHNLGQASRIPGIAPADISVLMIALKRASLCKSNF